jgi:threonylcarbamoyladenosine tRNA methylthiotransferase MtaB
VPRIRLSSLDIWDLTPGLLEAMATNRRVCPHLHLPLQSGDAGILSAMRRPYTPDVFVEKVGQARQAIPDLAITSDVMVGFPGESQEAFENTVRLVESLQLDGLHVFRFSPRPGTPAAQMSGDVAESVKKERCERLLAIAQTLWRRFAERFVGKRVEVLFETHDPATGLCEGFSQHYLRVAASAGPDMRNNVASVVISEARCDLAVATLTQKASA